MNENKRILITGGCGFIGSHLVRHFVNKYRNYDIIVFDALTYAGNLMNISEEIENTNCDFVLGDITDEKRVKEVFIQFDITDVIHLAAESHVDRSISDPMIFEKVNVGGTLNLLNTALNYWMEKYGTTEGHRFHHVSTDEVYGSLSLDSEERFVETMPYKPNSPYSASKASSDHFVRAFGQTYGMDVTISNCSNNYGPNQYPEKLIPLAVSKLKEGKKIPVYGNGSNVRDWLYVEDHVKAIDLIFHNAKPGMTYNVGGDSEKSNIQIVHEIINAYNKLNSTNLSFDECVEFVEDRKGHDMRYAIDHSKLTKDLGWTPIVNFDEGIERTVKSYI